MRWLDQPDDVVLWMVGWVTPLLAAFLLLAVRDSVPHLVLQAVCGVVLVLVSHGPTGRYVRLGALALVTAALIVLGRSWASPVMPVLLTLIAMFARSLGRRRP